MDCSKPTPRPEIQRYFAAMTDKKSVTKGKKLHPFSQIFLEALDEYSKTKNRTDIDKQGVMSMTAIRLLTSGERVPQKLTRKLRSAIEFLGYDPDAAWVGKLVKITPTTPPDPNDMLKQLLETDRAKTVIDMLSALYRDEFSSIDG